MMHSCAAVLCETDHRCDCNSCADCHVRHIENAEQRKFWGDCLWCADEIAYEIHIGARCKHGQYVTDIECQECANAY